MLQKFYFLFLFCITFNMACAWPPAKTDSLLKIINVKDKKTQTKLLVRFIVDDFLHSPINKLDADKNDIKQFLQKYNVPNKHALEYFAEGMYQRRLAHTVDAENAMIKAIQYADKNGNFYLSYSFLNHLAYIQTEEGNVIGAVSSYRLAKKYAVNLNDNDLQMKVDINISDVYYKNDFYSQSLFYLNEAQAIGERLSPADERIKNIIAYNKAENFFRMNKPDSLLVYNQKLKQSKANTYKLYTFKNRTTYYLYLLRHDYKSAINLISTMQKDKAYMFDDHDLQNLSDAYYSNGQLDSAKLIINQLLSNPSQANHPEIKGHLYNVLGEIAHQQNDYKAASNNFKFALQQYADNMNRLTQVNNISSLIKADEIEGYYSQKSKTYKRERMGLIITVVFALLVILVITMFYRTIKQKRHYEKLFFTAKKEELSFINSHEVRKHLTNILGIIEVIKHGENKEKEYFEAEEHLFNSAGELDKAIKNISEKLDY